MPRKKTEPEVLQEEVLQSENPNPEMPIEELPAEQPVLEPRTEEVLAEEPAAEAPVQPYGEEEVAKEEAPAEAAEPEKKSFYDLDFRAGSLAGAAAGVEHDLCFLPQPKRHARHDHRRRSAFHDHPQRTDRRGRNKADVLRSHCAVPRAYPDSRDGNVGGK